MSEELKPCPFCGGDAKVQEHCGCYYVICNNCSATSGVVQSKKVYSGNYLICYANEVIDKWNRRA